MDADHKAQNLWRFAMNFENPVGGIIPERKKAERAGKDEIKLPSRLTDEKISDEAGSEANANSALAPAGLKNPFWN
jgi:hypothetical protein